MTEQFTVILNLFQDLITQKGRQLKPMNVKKSGGQASLECKKIGRYEGKLLSVNSLSSNPPTLLSSNNHSGGNASLIPTYGLRTSIKRNAAFTLAEVLITLGIIGVVAALTMPSLINRTQKQELVAQYKKVYSVISQAYLMILNDNGGSFDGLANSDNDYIDIFSKYIKDVKVCKTNEEVTKCYLDSYKHLDGAVVNTDVGTILTTPDGATLRFNHSSSACTGTTELKEPIGCGRIRVDVNGVKNPNTVGYDIFDFYITQKGILPRGHEDTLTSEDHYSGWGRGITILTKGKIDY